MSSSPAFAAVELPSPTITVVDADAAGVRADARVGGAAPGPLPAVIELPEGGGGGSALVLSLRSRPTGQVTCSLVAAGVSDERGLPAEGEKFSFAPAKATFLPSTYETPVEISVRRAAMRNAFPSMKQPESLRFPLPSWIFGGDRREKGP